MTPHHEHELLIALALFALTLSLAEPAKATPNFPPAIARDLSIASPPDCSICHDDGDRGGLGTVNTPFGKNMRARGLVAFDTGSLTSALEQMKAQKVDSAGDCLDDVDELELGHDPNVPDADGGCGDGGAMVTQTPESESPTYGCVGSVAAPSSSGTAPFLAGLTALVGLVLGRRRRR